MKFGHGILLVSLALAISAPAYGEDDAYVAAALSSANGTVGFAEGADEDGVKAKALAECKTSGATDCQVAISGKDMCISLARATNKNALGLGGGSSRAASQNEAMTECAKNGAEGCNIHDTYCAPQTSHPITPAIAEDGAYVAAALSSANGTVGFAEGADDDGVKAKALAECKTSGATDCQVAISGKDMCISLARATNKNALGLGGGSSRAASQNEAMTECAKNGAEGCNIHDTYCVPQSVQ